MEGSISFQPRRSRKYEWLKYFCKKSFADRKFGLGFDIHVRSFDYVKFIEIEINQCTIFFDPKRISNYIFWHIKPSLTMERVWNEKQSSIIAILKNFANRIVEHTW